MKIQIDCKCPFCGESHTVIVPEEGDYPEDDYLLDDEDDYPEDDCLDDEE